MKMLAVSLHRLGDLIMHAHVLKSLNDETGISVNLLTHPFVKQIQFLFPFVSNFYVFERSHCQKSIGEFEYNKVWPFRHINKILENINKENYDQIIDLSQSDTSARWMSFLHSYNKIGVMYDVSLEKKIFCSENSWIRYLHLNSHSKIHFIDLFKKSLYLPLEKLPQPHLKNLDSKIIVFQTLTSDKKKNWPAEKWKKLILKLVNDFPQFEYKIVTSPDEFKQLKEEYSFLDNSVSLICTSMEESYQLLMKSRLLITLDTAMKHLAVWAGVPIIELALGSSNPNETGAYQDGALILKSKVSCAPCRHSGNCSQSSYLCQEDLSVESVFEAVRLQFYLHSEEVAKLKNNEEFSLNNKNNKISQTRADRIKSFIKIHRQNPILSPLNIVEADHDGWWVCNSVLSYEKGENNEGRSKKSFEINNEANR